jgi:hypothetical protein
MSEECAASRPRRNPVFRSIGSGQIDERTNQGALQFEARAALFLADASGFLGVAHQ